jgi:hypothetical protein
MIRWELLESETPKKGLTEPWQFDVLRAKVPGGWLVAVCQPFTRATDLYRDYSCTFYPDPNHSWNGSSISN